MATVLYCAFAVKLIATSVAAVLLFIKCHRYFRRLSIYKDHTFYLLQQLSTHLHTRLSQTMIIVSWQCFLWPVTYFGFACVTERLLLKVIICPVKEKKTEEDARDFFFTRTSPICFRSWSRDVPKIATTLNFRKLNLICVVCGRKRGASYINWSIAVGLTIRQNKRALSREHYRLFRVTSKTPNRTRMTCSKIFWLTEWVGSSQSFTKTNFISPSLMFSNIC